MNNIEKTLDSLYKNDISKTIISIVLALYAGAFAPALPNGLIQMADTIVGKLVFIFLIGYLATDRKNMQLAIMVEVLYFLHSNF